MKLPETLLNAYKKGRLAHAYLFYGLAPEEYQQPVIKFFQKLTCKSSSPPCCSCRECEQVEKLIHPDLTVLNEAEKRIAVDTVREEIIHRSHLTPASSDRLLFWINDISRLTTEASNALLKVLEEPPGEAVFVLTARSRWECLPTIRSRCQWIRFVSKIKPADSANEALENFWSIDEPFDELTKSWKKLLTGELTSDKINWNRKRAKIFLSFLLSWIHQCYTNKNVEKDYLEIFKTRNLSHRIIPLILERFSELDRGGQPLLVINSLLEEIYYPEETTKWLNVT